ncbi:MAG: capsule assembly Wzi family protein [Pseudomonadota bacterium]
MRIKYFNIKLVLFLALLIYSHLYPAAYISLNDPVYEQLEVLRSYGLIDAEIVGTKPYTRQEVALLISDALYNGQRRLIPQGAEVYNIVNDLMSLYREEVLWYAGGQKIKRYIGLKSPEVLRFSYDYYNAQRNRYSSDNARADITPMNAYNEGRLFSEGHNFNIENENRLQLLNFIDVVFDNRFEFIIPTADGDDDNFRWSVLKLYMVFEIIKDLQIEVGRNALVWGQGKRGQLLFSGNTENLGEFDHIPFIRITNARPTVLKPLGAFKYQLFFTTLAEARQGFPHSKLFGARIDFKPARHFEFGLSQAILLGGQGSQANFWDGLGGFWGFASDDPNYAEGNTSGTLNRYLEMDFSLRIPQLNYSEVFAEFMLDDFSELGSSFDNYFNVHTGLHVPRITTNGGVGSELEYTHTSKTSYQSMTYSDGFTRNNRFFGNNLGPNAHELYSSIILRPSYKNRHTLFFNFTKRSVSQYTEIPDIDVLLLNNKSLYPDELGFAGGWQWQFVLTKNAIFKFHFGYERLINFANVVDDDRNQFFTGVFLELYNPEFRIRAEEYTN